MAIKITAEIRRALFQQMGQAGGKARAERYSSEQLSKWAKKGGRPRKDEQAEPAQKRTSSGAKGRRK